jgi:hypothetical protein
MTQLYYPDAYLQCFCDDEREERAYAAVDLLGTFEDSWRDSLTIIKCYILACLENQASAEDLFTAKLKTYSKEFEGLLDKARTAAPDDDGNYAAIFSIPLERA